MDRAGMPEHIRRHSYLVAAIGVYLTARLDVNRVRLDPLLVEAGGLLHDIGKMEGVLSGRRHDDLGARMLHDWGLLNLSPIVQEHASLDFSRLYGPINESLIVNYADKRVMHDRIVTIGDRFEDLVVRYAKTREQAARLRERLEMYRILEGRILEHLAVPLHEAELMQLSLMTGGAL
jgi:putative nucleotidyltransferase with HDIG domain